MVPRVQGAQLAHNLADRIFLEEPYTCHSRSTRFQAGHRILQRHSAQSKYRNLSPARLSQLGQSRWPRSGVISFPEYWGEDREVGAVGSGARDIFGRMAGGADERRPYASGCVHAARSPDVSYLDARDVV
jgi:hypothetical protein